MPRDSIRTSSVLLPAGWRYGEVLGAADPLYLRATTACLCAIISMQVVNVFLYRSSVRSVFSMSPFSNRLILYGVALELGLMLIAVYTSWAHGLLGTAVVSPVLWWWLIPFAAGMLLLDELRKWLVRRIFQSHPAVTRSLRGSRS